MATQHFHEKKAGPGFLLSLVIMAVLSLALPKSLVADEVQATGTAQQTIDLMVFGDSLAHGYGLPHQATFPTQLEEALRAKNHSVNVINAGNSGDTTRAALNRLDWALNPKPDAMIVILGANDGLRGLDPGDTYRNLDALLTRLEAQNIPVLLAGMLAPRNLGADYVREFDKVYPRLAAQHDVVFYPFFLEGVATDPALNQGDGIHPNQRGVSVIVKNILPFVEELLGKAFENP